ncbi:pentatricopeptide repeat-containing protein At5g40410, mitochondrial-like [Amborella trichopoda]|uniref:pentatricopeptide repeat-containing protein At5g40410, mitochondrial-like n=1 Tax=Amborella trichopoda TaxID=13333 RepID=UPI0005D30D74|nr:pentatricopeptide repeat-containing protein At5g40410, mitochondrial-like [Amborella trichopoda]XP_020517266.1 pentatricopeptide repeat-containing protein At5g40410, mitochondrial-like [Amborella trichopoda]|eukprot:XP_011629070.1 pentatricopeptide repeat-containing protein At5g40410, mitochondrial-like [Amborella trichopoda]
MRWAKRVYAKLPPLTPSLPLFSIHSCPTIAAKDPKWKLQNLSQCKKLHAQMLVSGSLFSDQETNLIKLFTMYLSRAQCPSVHELIDQFPQRTTSFYNHVLRELHNFGLFLDALWIYKKMNSFGIKPDCESFPYVLKSCDSKVFDVRQIQTEVIKFGFDSNPFVGECLVSAYAKCFLIREAQSVFNSIPQRGVTAWNSLVVGYFQCGDYEKGLDLFRCLRQQVKAGRVTVAKALGACASLRALDEGKDIHEFILKTQFETDAFVETALIDMYAKCGCVSMAIGLFETMPKKDLVTWNALITGLVRSGNGVDGLVLFHQMRLTTHLKPNEATLVNLTLVCAELGALDVGKNLHSYALKAGFCSHVNVGNSFMAMYGKCHHVDDAWLLFRTMHDRSLVSWNTIISIHTQNKRAYCALKLFVMLRESETRPDCTTLMSVLQACSLFAALKQSHAVHGYVIRGGFSSDVRVGTALVDAYTKCGYLCLSRQAFDEIVVADADAIAWSAMLAGYAMHGRGHEALEFFTLMESIGVTPDHVSFTHVLSACSHAGLVREGKQYFARMTNDYAISPQMDHYSCIVDLLGRSGLLNEAYELIEAMPIAPNAGVWGALLGACRIHHDINLAKIAAEQLFLLDPIDPGPYVILSNIYSAAGRWNEVSRVRALMRERGLKKDPGCSFFELNGKVHSFVVGDRSHPESEKIYARLKTLVEKSREVGYVPMTEFVLHDVEEEMKEELLWCHSEKLAIAFGLLTTSKGTPIVITKNLRICGDCHNAAKVISSLEKRDITIRDSKRFHHFNQGSCSCGDYW